MIERTAVIKKGRLGLKKMPRAGLEKIPSTKIARVKLTPPTAEIHPKYFERS